MKVFEEIKDVKEIRKKTGLNQIDFWGKVGVTQSGGSRYETGRKMPKPVRELLRLVHIQRNCRRLTRKTWKSPHY